MLTSGRTTHVAGMTALITAIVLAFGSSSAFAQTESDGGWWGQPRHHQNFVRKECRKRANRERIPRGPARRAFIRKCIETIVAGYFAPPGEGGISVMPAPTIWNPWLNRGSELFVGVNIGAGFQGTNFSVGDTGFNVNGSGFLGGGFGGVLFPIPNTDARFGFRTGWEGMNISGKIESPAASPFFDYTVRSTSMFYEDALAKVPLAKFDLRGSYVTGSVGLAQMQTSVTGTSGAFSVPDNAYRTGLTFTAGIGTTLGILPNGAGIDGFLQWRGTQWNGTVSIPGSVSTGSFTNEVDVGLQIEFSHFSPRLWAPEAPQP